MGILVWKGAQIGLLSLPAWKSHTQPLKIGPGVVVYICTVQLTHAVNQARDNLRIHSTLANNILSCTRTLECIIWEIHSTPKVSIKNQKLVETNVYGAPPRFISGLLSSEYSTNLKVYTFFWS